MPIDAKRAQAIFATAIDLADASERAVLLDRECGGDAELRRRVELLLAAHDDSAGLPAADPHGTGAFVPSAKSIELSPGTLFAGRYKIREKLGEGGMGTVYVADQIEPVQRRIALKIIKTDLASDRLLARFEQERQALALMDHPNIAKVLDAGVSDSTPYFAMELIKGVPITKYCDEAKLTPKQRLELFIPVCQAVQHAHQKGIIHRDLKPSNILIGLYDGRAVPKVIDFGVAKATGAKLTDQSVYTEVGSLIGTLEYMSPEQAELNNLDIDTRTDIYALGVVLYELLTGTVPHSRKELKSAGFAEMLRIIKEVEPPKPSTRLSGSGSLPSIAASRHTEPKKLTALVRNDLDWIVMKALEKDRSRRYETANGFAMDIQRYLADEPVIAGPPSVRYRMKKFVRRNRPQVVAAGMVLFALLAGIAGTTLGLLEARKQERLASERADAEVKERQRADAETQKVQATLVVVGERTKLAQDAFGDMVGDMQTLLQTRPGTQDLRRALLEKARTGLAKILEEARKQGTPDSTLVWSHIRMGDVEQQLGNTAAAQKEYQAGHELAQKLADAEPNNAQAQRDLGTSIERLGVTYERLGQTVQALAMYRQMRTIKERLAVADPKNSVAQRELSVTWAHLGDVTLQLGQTKDALDFYRKSRDVDQQLADADPKNTQAQRDLSVSCNNLGNVTLQLGQTQDALDFYRKDNEIAQKLADADPKNAQAQRDLSVSFNKLGEVTLQLGQTKDALDFYRKCSTILQRLTDADPKNAQAQRDLSVSFDRLGDVTVRLGQTKDALDFYQKSLDLRQQLADADPKNAQAQRDLSVSFNNLGNVTLQLGQTKDALDFYRKCSTILQRLADADPKNAQAQRDLSISFGKLGDVTLQLGQTKDALGFYQKSLDLRQRLADADPKNAQAQRDLSINFGNLGNVTLQLGQTKDALDFYRKCSTILQRLADADPTSAQTQRDLSISFGKLGDVTLQLGQTKDTLDFYRKSLDLRQRLADADPKDAQAQMDLFVSFYKLGRIATAEHDYLTAAGWFEKGRSVLLPWHERKLLVGQFKNAVADMDRQIATCRMAEQAIADLEFALKQPAAVLPGLLDIRTQVFAKKNDRNNLIATAAAYEKLATTDDHHCYNAACAWSQASGVAKDDAKLREEYATKAMTLLRKIPTGKGHFVDSPAKLAAHMKKDTDLDALRGREDFKKLLADLEKSNAPAKP